jgi:hypothetical protein
MSNRMRTSMSAGFNVFGPDDLTFAEGILDEVWTALPGDIRNGPDADLLRERMARHVLAALSNSSVGRDELRAAAMKASTAAELGA